MFRPLPLGTNPRGTLRSARARLALRAEHLFGLSESGYYERTQTNEGNHTIMAPQTRTQRQAAAKKAAATRKRNSAKQSSGTAKASVRRTTTSASNGSQENRSR